MAVVILNWNGRHLLERCIPSVAASEGVEFQIYVADNGSEDGSVAWLREHWPLVHVVENGKNLRFAAGNNAGAIAALESGAEILLLLNNDARIAQDTLAEMARAFANEPGLGVLGPRIDYDDDTGRLWYGGGRALPALGWFGHRAIRRRSGEGADPAGSTDWVTGCALAIRENLWRQLGGLDDSYYIYAEDTDLCLRARKLGAKIGYVPSAHVWHAVSASVGGGRSAFKTYHQHRARARLLRRHLRSWHWPTALLGVLAQDVLLLGLLLSRGNLRAVGALMAAWLDLWSATPRYRVS